MGYAKVTGYTLVAGAGLLIAGFVMWASQPLSVPLSGRQTFDSSAEGWVAAGSRAQVGVTHSPSDVKNGPGALELEYEAAINQFGSAVLLVGDKSLAGMQRLRFWIKTDDDTAAAVVLSEKRPDGGDFAAWFWCPKQDWQLIELRPEDFAISEGAADATDGNGRLDLERVQAVGFIDIGQFFGMISQDSAYPLMLKRVTGTHRLQVDDFEILRDGPASDGPRTRIGDPARGFISWITLGGATLSISKPGSPLDAAALEARYERQHGKYSTVAHGLSTLTLGGINTLTFEAASIKDAAVIMYLEERNPGRDSGPRYSATFQVPGGSVASRQTLELSRFAYDATSPPDPDGHVTPDRLKTISLIDATPPATPGTEGNTLWISAIEATAR